MKKLAWVSTKKIMSKSISKTINIYKFTYHLLDIDECADPELSWDCTAGCKNLNGTYKCLPSLVGRVEPTDGDGFSPGEIVCKSGFKLSDDGSECQDINECDLADIDSDSWRMTYRYCDLLTVTVHTQMREYGRFLYLPLPPRISSTRWSK